MEKTNDVVSLIGQIIGNKSFISSLMQDMTSYSSERIEERLATVIKYYIATRDSNIDYTYQEIEDRYNQIKGLELEPDTELYRNTVTHGFLTHSFNGYKKDRIMRYGLNYIGNIKDEKTLEEIKKAREMVQGLESILGQSKWLSQSEHLPDEVFLASPGTKTIYYACQNAPERLYQGPLKGYDNEPIVVGETKQTYILRYLIKKIQQKYPDANSTEYINALELAKSVTEYFCSKPPAVLFLKNEQMKEMPVSTENYKPNSTETLEEYIKSWIETAKRPKYYRIKGEKGLIQVKRYRLKKTGEEVEPIKVKAKQLSSWDIFYDEEDELEEEIIGYKLISNGKEVPSEEVEVYTKSYQDEVFVNNLKPRIIGYKLKETGERVEPIIDFFGGNFITGEDAIIGYKLAKTGEEISSDSVEAIRDGYYIEKEIEDEFGVSEKKRIELKEDEVEPIYKSFEIDKIFTFMAKDGMGDLGDLVTLSQYIPDEAIAGVIDMVDEFEMKQIFARSRGIKVGDLIDSYYCQYVGEPSIEQLLDAITPNCTEEDLEEIRKKYEELTKSRGIEPKTKDEDAKKQEILKSQYPRKQGISTEYTLEDVLAEFEQNSLMPILLEQDTRIEQDELQYKSNTHGVPHTRRVNFFAMAIMNMENITGRDREVILEIVKNHDIGRSHDWEDSEHGEESVAIIDEHQGRLEGFSSEEQEIIKFVIAQHSKSAKDNKQAISELPEELRKKYARILDVFKDADKLDRVRLDPYGQYPREGLDVTRLSLESSKKLENVAYESYSKLFEILEVERQIQVVRDETTLEQQKEQEIALDAEFERRMQAAKETIVARKQKIQTGNENTDTRKAFLRSIVEKSKEEFGLSGINRFVTNVKAEIMKFFNPNKDLQQNGR